MRFELTAGDDPRAVGGDVRFSLTIDGVMQRFVISHEALADHFDDKDARANDPLAAFESAKAEIVAAAAEKFAANTADMKPGIIALTTSDFD